MSPGKTRVLCLLALASAPFLPGDPVAGREGRPPREAPATLGTLTCSLSEQGNAGTAAQRRDILCQFRARGRGSVETYAGSLQAVGQVEGLFGRGTVMLEIRGPASLSIVPGVLQQVYAAEASAAVSAAAPLIGQTNNAIVLQPLTKEEGRVAAGKARPEAAIVIIELKLKSTPT
jgi:hypothetical protein